MDDGRHRRLFLGVRGASRLITVVTTGLLFFAGSLCMGQGGPRELCPDTTISGQVASGERFEAMFADSLHFILQPSIGPPNPEGWTIRVTGSNPDHDFLLVATPPYRFNNPRYLDTSYGHTAQEAVAWSERSFSFVLNEMDFQRMFEAIGVLLWPADEDSSAIATAREVLDTVEKGAGLFRILSSETSPPVEEAPLGRIERVVFEADLCLQSEG